MSRAAGQVAQTTYAVTDLVSLKVFSKLTLQLVGVAPTVSGSGKDR